ncbi:hypothetical protein BG004_000783 [Podila humilis]|nr:hypothetical protein BG004_000783 [Podila humilis]
MKLGSVSAHYSQSTKTIFLEAQGDFIAGDYSLASTNMSVSYLPLALAAYAGFISLISMVMRAAVGNGLIAAAATYGLATEALTVHSPGFFDIVFYAQFMLMTGQLSLNYPSFYSTFTSLYHWSFLEFKNSFAGKGPDNSSEILAYGGAGSVNMVKDTAYIGSNAKRNLDELYDLSQFLPTVNVQAEAAIAPVPTRLEATPHVVVHKFVKRQMGTEAPGPSPSPKPVTPSPSPVSPSPPSPTTKTSSKTTTKTKKSTSTDTPNSTSTSPTTFTTPSNAPATITPKLIDNPFGKNNNVPIKQYNESRFGIEAYAAAIGANPANLFLCTLINTVIAGGVSLFLSTIYLVAAWVKSKESHLKGKTLQHAFSFVGGNVLRVWTLLFTPMALSAMYQLTIAGGTAMMAIASASLLILSVGVTVLLTWRILRASTKLLLFEDIGTLLKFGSLYSTLTEEGTLFFLVTLLVRFLWALTVAMLSSYGMAQVAVLLVIELGYMMVIGFKWPFADSSENKFNIFMCLVRIAVTGCSIAYIHDLKCSTEMRQLFGYIQMALHLTVFIVMFALAKWNTILVIIFWRTRHSAIWKSHTINYSFEDVDTEHDWVLTGRPRSALPGRDPALEAIKARRYTVQPYTSISDIRHESMVPGSEDGFQPRNPRELYRRSMHHSQRRSRFPSDDDHGLMLDVRPEAIVPLSSSAGPMSARSTSPHPHSSNGSIESSEGLALPLQQVTPASIRFQAPQRESYAKFQRMNHQQAVIDPRTRRMSDIFKDGPYLYQDNSSAAGGGDPKSTSVANEKTGVWSSVKSTLGGYLKFGTGSRKGSGDSTKPKAFEVIRPQRPPPIREPTNDNVSQMGDDNLRELNSIGISRFFQESGGAYERNRSLFVANPEAFASRAGSVRSSVSGMRPKFERGETGTSVYTLGGQLGKPSNISADRGSILTGLGSSSMSELGGTSESRRVSVAHPRNSVESNLAEALMTEAPLLLQNGGILKVSKGPEKAVQYYHKGSSSMASTPILAEQPAPGMNSDIKPITASHSPLTSPSMLLLPSTRSTAFFDTTSTTNSNSINNNNKQPSIKSKAGSRPDSPTESHHSQNLNVAVSAGRMHEILDRMFSDPDDSDSFNSDDEETCSTFSGKVSAAILALRQRRNQEESELDAQSMYRTEILEPVLEQVDADDEGGEAHVEGVAYGTSSGAIRGTLKRASSATDRPRDTGTLMRTYTGPTRAPSSPSLRMASNISVGTAVSAQRPLAHTPLHAPSVMPFSGSTASLGITTSAGGIPGTLSRKSSQQSNLSRQSSQQSFKSVASRSTTTIDYHPLGVTIGAAKAGLSTVTTTTTTTRSPTPNDDLNRKSSTHSS